MMGHKQAASHRVAWAFQYALLVLVMSPNLLWYWQVHSPLLAVQALVLPSLLLLFVYALLGNALWLASFLLAPFAVLAPLEAFYVLRYGRPTSSEVLASLFATTPREAREYLGHALAPMAIAVAGAFLLIIAATWCARHTRIQWRNRPRTFVLSVAAVIPCACISVLFASTQGGISERLSAVAALGSTISSSSEPTYPFGVVQRYIGYRNEWNEMRSSGTSRANFRFHSHRTGQIIKRQVYVLVIGESSRRDHWQLYGYNRETNPQLSKTSNLIALSDMITAWPESVTAVPLILTRKPINTISANFGEGSILRAMQEAGYETYWISNQLPVGAFDTPIATYAYEAQHVRWLNHASWSAPGAYDESLVTPLQDILKNSESDAFVVVHMMGSHSGYDFRYPAKFKQFKPTENDNDSAVLDRERVINSYDNTVRYTDYVLALMIGILRQSDATTALWYESDHGEMLPTASCSLRGHGIGTTPEYQVPAFFWFSDAYAGAFPKRVDALRSNLSARSMSADTFESLVDMAGVDFPGHERSRSLFGNSWQYRPRIVNGFWKTNFDEATLGKTCPIVMPHKDHSH